MRGNSRSSTSMVIGCTWPIATADPSARATCKSAPTGTTRSYICQNATLDRLVDRLNDDSGGYLQHKGLSHK